MWQNLQQKNDPLMSGQSQLTKDMSKDKNIWMKNMLMVEFPYMNKHYFPDHIKDVNWYKDTIMKFDCS